MSEAASYIYARIACVIARRLLEDHDFTKLLRDIEHSHALGPIIGDPPALGPIVDPALHREKYTAMDDDAKVFRGAVAFLRAWSEVPHG